MDLKERIDSLKNHNPDKLPPREQWKQIYSLRRELKTVEDRILPVEEQITNHNNKAKSLNEQRLGQSGILRQFETLAEMEVQDKDQVITDWDLMPLADVLSNPLVQAVTELQKEQTSFMKLFAALVNGLKSVLPLNDVSALKKASVSLYKETENKQHHIKIDGLEDLEHSIEDLQKQISKAHPASPQL